MTGMGGMRPRIILLYKRIKIIAAKIIEITVELIIFAWRESTVSIVRTIRPVTVILSAPPKERSLMSSFKSSCISLLSVDVNVEI